MKKVNYLLLGSFMALFSCNSSDKSKDDIKIDEQVKEEKVEPLKLGDKYEGGYIFFLDFEGKHGKICAPLSDGDNKLVPQKQAIAEAEKLTLNGFSDWRLPTKDELQIIRKSDEYTVFLFKNSFYLTSETKKDEISDVQFHVLVDMDKENGGWDTSPVDWNREFHYRVVRDF